MRKRQLKKLSWLRYGFSNKERKGLINWQKEVTADYRKRCKNKMMDTKELFKFIVEKLSCKLPGCSVKLGKCDKRLLKFLVKSGQA